MAAHLQGVVPMVVDVKEETAMDVTEDVKPKSFVSPGMDGALSVQIEN